MKLGTFLAILMLALVCLGFLINDSFHLHSELALARQSVATLQQEKSQLVQQIAQQANEIQALNTQYRTLEDQNKVLSSHNTELELQIQTLSTDFSTLQTENETLQKISTQLASDSNSSLVKFVLVLASLTGLQSGKTMLAVSIPPIFLIGSGILAYGLYSHSRKKTQSNTYMIRVSKRELDAIVRHRRAK